MSHRIKHANGKVNSWVPSGRISPDYITYFPSNFPHPEEWRDEYGNFCYELHNEGTPEAKFVKVDVTPTAEQTSAVRKRRIVTEMNKAGYDKNVEIAILKDAIKEVADKAGIKLPTEFVKMEQVRESIKVKVEDERTVRG